MFQIVCNSNSYKPTQTLYRYDNMSLSVYLVIKIKYNYNCCQKYFYRRSSMMKVLSWLKIICCKYSSFTLDFRLKINSYNL